MRESMVEAKRQVKPEKKGGGGGAVETPCGTKSSKTTQMQSLFTTRPLVNSDYTVRASTRSSLQVPIKLSLRETKAVTVMLMV